VEYVKGRDHLRDMEILKRAVYEMVHTQVIYVDSE
jgi:hypothetical protein